MRSRAPPVAQPGVPIGAGLHNHAQSPPSGCTRNPGVAFPCLPQLWIAYCNPGVRWHNLDVHMQPCRARAQPRRAPGQFRFKTDR